MAEAPTMAAMAALSVAEIRSRLQSLETEREVVLKKKALEVQRLQWIDTRQQQEARLAQLLPTQSPPHEATASPEPPEQEAQPENATVKVVQTKRELVEALREQTLQVLKKQKEVAAKISGQLRSLRQNDRPAPVSSGRSSPAEPLEASPASSPPKTSPAEFPVRRSNKLVLVSTASSVLGKRHAPQSSPSAVQRPSVHFPPLVAVEDAVYETPAQLASLAFRVATRHFLRTGKKCSFSQLKETLAVCTSRAVTEEEARAAVCQARALQLVVDGYDSEAAGSSQTGSLNSVTTSTVANLSKSEVKALMEAEKLVVDEMVASWTISSSTAPRSMRLIGAINATYATSILGEWNTEQTSVTSLENLLAGCLRTDRRRDMIETAYPHLSPVLKVAKELFDSGNGSESVARPSSSLAASSTTFRRPFDLEQSVMKQIQRTKRRRRSDRADPMKVLCMYELSGVCNDPNCPYQHQRDFEEGGDCSGDDISQVDGDVQRDHSLMSESTRISLNQFMQLREDMKKWWPSPKKILEKIEPENATQDRRQPRNEKVSSTKHTPPDASDGVDALAANQDFLELGSSSSDESDDNKEGTLGRYCVENGNDAEADGAFSDLQQHVATNPEDADAWLLLALRCLKLDVTWSDDQARLSTSARVLSELESFHSLLHSSPSDAAVAISEENIVQSLHVLSRALEIEANAYCEELWLTHLRLSKLLTKERDVDTEQGTTEQALGFLPNSVQLWRHLLKLQQPNLDSLEDAATMYHGQLQIIAAASQQAKQQDVKDAFSVLLCDIVVQLSALQCCAGRPDEALSFLWSLVGGNYQDVEEEKSLWHTDVRNQMIGDDLLILYCIHAHIALFGEVPLWLRERAFDDTVSINVFRLLLSLDTDSHGVSCDWKEGQRICEAAFKAFGDHDFVPPGLEVLRHNWVVIVANDRSVSTTERIAKMARYVDEARQWKTFLPRVWTVLARVFRDIFDKPDMADQLIEELMQKYRENSSTRYERFGEALHHYLLHRPSLFGARDSLGRTQFPNLPFLVSRLIAMLPANDPVYSRRAIKRIVQEPDTAAGQEALRTAFHALIRDTLDYVVECQLAEGGEHASDEQDITQDTYYLVAQVQLLSQVFGPQEAIDALELCVMQGGSSKWSVLPRECRRLVWSARFLLQCELLKSQSSEATPSRELFPLLRRYFMDVGPQADTSSAVKRQLRECLGDLEGRGEEGSVPAMRQAVSACLEESSSRSSTLSALDMELFRLCLHSVPSHERPSHYASFQPHLVDHPHFLLEFLDASIQDSDRRRVRNALRYKALQESTPLDAASLETLVLLDVKDKNIRGLAQLLPHRARADPLDRTSWDMLNKLEILFGARERGRAEEFAAALAKTNGVQIYTNERLGGLLDREMPSASSMEWTLNGVALTRVPPVLSISLPLQVLDLSHNLLVSVPTVVCQLTQLRQLNLSGNALTTLPEGIGQLSKLETIGLAHNNLTEIPNAFWDGLLQLREVDLRYNALLGISPRVLRLVELQKLRIVGNNITWKDLQHIAAKLPAATVVDIRPKDGSEATPSGRDDVLMVDDEDQALAITETSEKPVEITTGSTLQDKGEAKEDEDMIDLSESKDEEEPKSTPNEEEAEVVDVDDDVEMTEDATAANPIEIDIPTTPEPSVPPQAARNIQNGSDEGSDSDDEVQFLGSSPSKSIPVSVPAIADPSVTIHLAQATSPASRSPSSHQSSATITRQIAAKPVDRSSVEWRNAITGLLNRTPGQLRKCTQCFAEDTTGTHQRLNGLTLCAPCLREAVSIVWEHHTAAAKPK